MSGTQCAGTILGGNYPYNSDSRLISPKIVLPAVVSGKELVLRFREYWSYQSADRGEVQFSVNEGGVWSGWTVLSARAKYGQ